jgi:hypothetical protein
VLVRLTLRRNLPVLLLALLTFSLGFLVCRWRDWMEDGLDVPDVQEERKAHSLPSYPLFGIETDSEAAARSGLQME